MRSYPSAIGKRPTLTMLDWLLFWASVPLALVAVASFAIGHLWQLAVVAVCTCLASGCVLLSRHRRRSALAIRAAHPGDAPSSRSAAKIHLQELGLLLLAVGLWFVSGGAMSTLS